MFISVHYFILFLLVFIGIIDLIKILMEKIIISNFSKPKFHFFILLKGHIENIEYIVRSIIYSHKNNFLKSNDISIIFLNFGIDKETEKICKLLLNDYKYIKILNIKSKSHHSD